MLRLILVLVACVAFSSAHAYSLEQVDKAELDAKECRAQHAGGTRLAEILQYRHCKLLEELSKEKRKIYEDR